MAMFGNILRQNLIKSHKNAPNCFIFLKNFMGDTVPSVHINTQGLHHEMPCESKSRFKK